MMSSLAIDGPTLEELRAWCRVNLREGFRIDWYWCHLMRPLTYRDRCYTQLTPTYRNCGPQYLTLLCNSERELLLAKLRWHGSISNARKIYEFK